MSEPSVVPAPRADTPAPDRRRWAPPTLVVVPIAELTRAGGAGSDDLALGLS